MTTTDSTTRTDDHRTREHRTIGRVTGIRGAARRILVLSRAEVRLLFRNKTALFTVLAMPLMFVAFFYLTSGAAGERMELGSYLGVTMIGFVLLFVVYYNMVTTLVARREELVLKRLRTGETTDMEIVVGAAVPSLLIAAAQVLLVGLAATMLTGIDMPVNPILLVVGFIAGTAIFVLLAVASTAFTRTTEMAQLTTLPVVLVSMLTSGMTFPLDAFPDAVERVARVLPLTPVVQLIQLGLEGSTGGDAPTDFAGTFGEGLVPLVVMAVWLYLGVYATRRWFRWEPRA